MTVSARKIDEALAFFQLFERGRWTSCHVRTGDMEIFVSRDASHRNPVFAQGLELGTPITDVIGEVLTAPHLGTLFELAPVGTNLEVGQIYAVLTLLDERVELTADHAGIVAEHLQPIGGLVEYDRPLIRLH